MRLQLSQDDLDRYKTRFWARVSVTDGCWVWTGRRKREGYGEAYIGQRGRVVAHRFSYALHYGLFDKSLCVCHRCDNTSCVRPDHLFLGTMGDNNRDRVSKNRSANGSQHGKSKLTEAQVLEIRKRYIPGQVLQSELGELFNVNRRTIGKIVNRDRWIHI